MQYLRSTIHEIPPSYASRMGIVRLINVRANEKRIHGFILCIQLGNWDVIHDLPSTTVPQSFWAPTVCRCCIRSSVQTPNTSRALSACISSGSVCGHCVVLIGVGGAGGGGGLLNARVGRWRKMARLLSAACSTGWITRKIVVGKCVLCMRVYACAMCGCVVDLFCLGSGVRKVKIVVQYVLPVHCQIAKTHDLRLCEHNVKIKRIGLCDLSDVVRF